MIENVAEVNHYRILLHYGGAKVSLPSPPPKKRSGLRYCSYARGHSCLITHWVGGWAGGRAGVCVCVWGEGVFFCVFCFVFLSFCLMIIIIITIISFKTKHGVYMHNAHTMY
jgi:hypothetical protein